MSQPFAEALNWVPKSRALAATLSRAHDFARAHGHATVGLEHLLLSLIEDPDAANVLTVSSIDLEALSGDAASHLATLVAEEGVAPVADDALLSILEYAVAAAQQSRRRDVNGGIVLAAIVGEGKSEAASLLRNHGMTFQAAIEAIKGSARPTTGPPAAPVRVPEPPPPPPATVEQQEISDAATTATEEILWRARQRVEALQTPTPVITRSVTAPPSKPEPEPDAEPAPAPVPKSVPEHTEQMHSAAATVTDLDALAEPKAPGASQPIEPMSPRPAPSWLPPTPPEAPASARMPGRAPPPMPPLDSEPSSVPPTSPPPLPDTAKAANGHAAARPAGDVSWSARPGAPPPLPNVPKRAKEPAGEDDGVASNGTTPGRPKKKGRGTAQPALVPDTRTFEAIADRLAHSIPRRISGGHAAEIELRLQRSEVDALLGERAIPGSAISLRLRVVSGPGHVEAITPETQWLAPVSAKQDQTMAWRWSIVPHRRGLLRLELAGTVRIVSSNGGAAETDLPEQGVEALAGVNLLKTGGKALVVAGFTAAGALLDDHAEPLITAALKTLAKLTGGP